MLTVATSQFLVDRLGQRLAMDAIRDELPHEFADAFVSTMTTTLVAVIAVAGFLPVGTGAVAMALITIIAVLGLVALVAIITTTRWLAVGTSSIPMALAAIVSVVALVAIGAMALPMVLALIATVVVALAIAI
jgi:hypothetical protein